MFDRELKTEPAPGPIVFPMHALKYLETADLNAAQRKAISVLFLKYLKGCREKEIELIDGMVREIGDLGSKV